MTEETKLTLLKLDCQLLTDANDTLLTHLLTLSNSLIAREGAVDDGSDEYAGIQIQYAAYLFRKRAASSAGGKESETAMPRYLRYALNNFILSQKAGESS